MLPIMIDFRINNQTSPFTLKSITTFDMTCNVTLIRLFGRRDVTYIPLKGRHILKLVKYLFNMILMLIFTLNIHRGYILK